VSRSLFDLYSNFTLFLNDPSMATDSTTRLAPSGGLTLNIFTRTAFSAARRSSQQAPNFHENQINVGLYPSNSACRSV